MIKNIFSKKLATVMAASTRSHLADAAHDLFKLPANFTLSPFWGTKRLFAIDLQTAKPFLHRLYTQL